jgi:steroid delta-isomerase-like uncharacterized protein
LPAGPGRDYGAQMDSREQREQIVREHMESENTHDFDVTLATFADHPRYEIVPTGEVYDGTEAVSRYYQETRTAFPDQRNELIALHHADDAVIVEFWLRGTHRGEFRGIPPTGKSFEARMAAFFLFEGERLVCERVYFDAATLLTQLGLLGG